MRKLCRLIFLSLLFIPARTARADFIITSAILEFTAGGPRQQDIELISHSQTNDYVVAETSEIVHPGLPDEKRVQLQDPAQAGLLVTPNRAVLAGGGRKVLRFVLMRDPDAQEHVYRVAIKPVIRGVDNNAHIGLKILVGYEVLVIVRPLTPQPTWHVAIQNGHLVAQNTGNTDILFDNGKQCSDAKSCVSVTAFCLYPGENENLALPRSGSVTYAIWDGMTKSEKTFN